MDPNMIRTDIYRPIKEFDDELSAIIDYAEDEEIDAHSLELLDTLQQSLGILLRHLKQQMGG